MTTKLLWLILPTVLSACATQKEWAAIGGSRADGVVVMSYSHGNMEIPTVVEDQAVTMALASCKSWGYSGAKPFGGETKRCTAPTFGGCNYWQVERQYQCTGQPDK